MWFAVAALLSSYGLTGCAYSYIDDDGVRHVIGLVDMEIRPTANSETFAGDVVEIQSIGLGYHRAYETTSIAIGYHRQVLAAFRNNALVLGNPITALNGTNRTTEKGKE